MLLVAAGLNGLSAWGARNLGAVRVEERRADAEGGLGALRGAPYLKLLGALALLVAAVELLGDYVLASRAAAAYGDGARLLGFFALFQMTTGLLALPVQLLWSRAATERIGLGGTLALLPIGVALTAGFGAVVPGLWTAALARGVEGTLRNTLFRGGYEALFAPVPDALKRATKTIIDVGFDRLGTAAASGLVMILARKGAAGASILLAVAAALALASLVVVHALHRGYVALLAEGLRVGEPLLAPAPESRASLTLTSLSRSLAGLALARLEQAPLVVETPAARAAALIPRLATPGLAFDALRVLDTIAPAIVGQLVDALLDPNGEPDARRRIPRLLARTSSPRAIEGLALALEDANVDVGREAARALEAMRRQSPSLPIDEAVVRRALRREAHATPPRLDHVCTLLSLLLPAAPLALAFRALRTSDLNLRGTALEYLYEIVPDDVREDLWTHLATQ
jgi:hypothetical protein